MATGIGCMQQQQQADPQAASEHEINGVPTNTLHSCRKIKKETKEKVTNFASLCESLGGTITTTTTRRTRSTSSMIVTT